MIQICLATNNAHKIEEIKPIFDKNIYLLSLNQIGCIEELPETGQTLEENSLEKASYVFNKYNIACISDDSGLEVMALNGAPGVDTAHYSGSRDALKNNTLLLKNLQNVADRTAQFKTVITYYSSLEVKQFTGIIKGKISEHSIGQNGFGYDPIFIPDGYDTSFAQMAPNLKNQISHRALAVRQLLNYFSTHKHH